MLSRPGASTHFVMLTDGRADCEFIERLPDGLQVATDISDATSFESALKRLNATAYGGGRFYDGAERPRFTFWSMVSHAEREGQEGQVLEPSAPLVEASCSPFSSPGTAYQTLSRQTDGYRYPICDPSPEFAPFFAKLAETATEAATACRFPVPTTPTDRPFDINTATLSVPVAGSEPLVFSAKDTLGACGSNGGFILDEGSQSLVLCPTSCDQVSSQGSAVTPAVPTVAWGCE